MSNLPMKRYKNLEGFLPFPISIWDVRRVTSRRQAQILEARLHRAFRKSRINGEWFDHKFFDLEKYLKMVKAYENAFYGDNPLKEA
jgi:hypothetical protein